MAIEASDQIRRRVRIVVPEGGYLITVPNKDYNGFTMNVEFYRGQAVVDDELARELGYKNAETLVRRMIDDYGSSGYACEPELPEQTEHTTRRGGLAERFEQVVAGEAGPVAPGRYCTSCGTQNEGEWKFCNACGSPRAQAAAAAKTAEQERDGDPGRVAPFFPPDKQYPPGSDPAVAIPTVSKLHERIEIPPAKGETGEGNAEGQKEQGQ